MARNQHNFFRLAALSLSLIACTSAYADRATPATGKALATTPAESPYKVDLIGENGYPLKVWEHRGRFYVLGSAGERYTIRVQNPTDRRVEAVVSVDGLDVIDGKTADLKKRGYVVPAWGELRVDGFRVSTAQVAAFRFSSVSGSYAGRKGQARNVGVIGVAIFEEEAPPQIVMPAPPPYYRGHEDKKSYDYRGDLEADDVPAAEPAPSAPAGSSAPRDRGQGRASGSVGRAEKSAPATRSASKSIGGAMDESYDPYCCTNERPERPGLGTEFGEYRHSAASWTQFVRKNSTRPTALAQLRYNDAPGLQALGIRLNTVDPNEITIRETADPFPGSPFAEPPR